MTAVRLRQIPYSSMASGSTSADPVTLNTSAATVDEDHVWLSGDANGISIMQFIRSEPSKPEKKKVSKWLKKQIETRGFR